MKYASIGTSTSGPEVTDISRFGIWILYRGKEYFLGYEEFPWFLNVPIRKIFAVTGEGPEHLRWPELDIDLSLDSIKHPGAFPLVYDPPVTYRQSGSGDNA
jgi:hypothetical protein